MKLWLSILAVTVASWVMKASGPLALGDRHLPATGVNIISLMTPVLLTGLLVVELGGPGYIIIHDGILTNCDPIIISLMICIVL